MEKLLKVTSRETSRLFLNVNCKYKNKPVYIETHELKLDWAELVEFVCTNITCETL